MEFIREDLAKALEQVEMIKDKMIQDQSRSKRLSSL